jgi:hypothetical protein
MPCGTSHPHRPPALAVVAIAAEVSSGSSSSKPRPRTGSDNSAGGGSALMLRGKRALAETQQLDSARRRQRSAEDRVAALESDVAALREHGLTRERALREEVTLHGVVAMAA